MHPSRRKGNRFERELLNELQAAGLRAERAWGSDGSTLTTDAGEPCGTDVDLLVDGWLKLQAKRRKAVTSFLKPGGADVTVVREDRGASLAVIPLHLLIELLRYSQYRP